MKQWFRILPFGILIFAVLTFLDYSVQPDNIQWLKNLGQATMLTAIGTLGQFLIHRNILQDLDKDPDDSQGCDNCARPE